MNPVKAIRWYVYCPWRREAIATHYLRKAGWIAVLYCMGVIGALIAVAQHRLIG